MSDEQSIEEEIAREIREYLPGADGEADSRTIATALSPLLNRVRAEAAAKAIQAHRDLHPTYGSTAACGGGIGGMTLTEHCAVVCQNPKHDAAKAAWHEVEMGYFESRRIEQNSEGNVT